MLTYAWQRRHRRCAGVVASPVGLQRRLGDVRPVRLHDLEVGAQASKRVVPVLLGVIACDAHVDHLEIFRLGIPAHEASTPDGLAALAKRVGLRLEMLDRQPLLLVVDNAVAPCWILTQRLKGTRRDRRGEGLAHEMLDVQLERVLNA